MIDNFEAHIEMARNARKTMISVARLRESLRQIMSLAGNPDASEAFGLYEKKEGVGRRQYYRPKQGSTA